MIREMLRPMLKDWLDENLPAIVEQLVERKSSASRAVVADLRSRFLALCGPPRLTGGAA